MLSAELREGHPEAAWRGAIDVRNRLIHGYLNLNLDRVWDTVEHDLPVLEAQVRAIPEELPE